MKRLCSIRWMPLGILVLVSSALAQSAQDDTDTAPYQTYLGNRDQFTVDVPAGWHVIDQSPYAETGVVAFYSQPIEIKLDKDPAVRQQQEEAMMQRMNDLTSGAAASFFVDRYKADKGISCDGFDARAQKKKLKVFTGAAALGRKPKIIGTPEVTAVDFGGCRGLRVTLRANADYGATLSMLVYTAAANGLTYDFALLAEEHYFAQNVPWFERMIASVHLAGAMPPADAAGSPQ